MIKKAFIFFAGLLITCSLFGCKTADTPFSSIKDIPPATASDDEGQILENGNEIGTDYDSLSKEELYDTERDEIAKNIKDAKELIESGDFEDANMILNSLKTRKLTSSEKKQITELQTRMISVSD